jgi:hypothetical protein
VSWIKRHPLWAIAALAFAVRSACAVVTEFKPIFPAYYYTDARLVNEEALAGLAALREGRAPVLSGPIGSRLHLLMTLDVYRVFGPRPLAVKLLNAALGAAGIAALVAAFGLVFPAPAAFASGIALALWPSHAFYTSQNLKESPTHALAFLGLAAAIALGSRPPASGARRSAFAAAAAAGLIGAGFFRSYILLCAAAALGAAFALEAARRKPRGPALAVLAVAAAAAACYTPASHAVFASLQLPGEESTMSSSDAMRIRPSFLPETVVDRKNTAVFRPTSPEGLSTFRHVRQESDRDWAAINAHREIATQIFPDVVFRSWTDVFAYLPKGAFYVLFMPLPGLYPMGGKLGRIAASAENLLLLTLACFAAAGILRGPSTAGRATLMLYFAAMATGAALLEFDLGSAGRHKLLYLPMLFPFAAEEILRLLGRKEPA